MNFIVILVSLLASSESVLVSDSFANVQAFKCPDPAKNSSQILLNTSLPIELFTPSKFT